MPVICVTVSKSICPIDKIKSYMIFLPAVLVTAGIAILSLTESTQMPSASVNDKLIHGLMYAVLAVAWLLPLVKLSPFTFHFSPYLVVLFGATAFGGLLELLQHYCTLTRSGDTLDLLADFVGATIGIAFVVLWKRLSTISH